MQTIYKARPSPCTSRLVNLHFYVMLYFATSNRHYPKLKVYPPVKRTVALLLSKYMLSGTVTQVFLSDCFISQRSRIAVVGCTTLLILFFSRPFQKKKIPSSISLLFFVNFITGNVNKVVFIFPCVF